MAWLIVCKIDVLVTREGVRLGEVLCVAEPPRRLMKDTEGPTPRKLSGKH